MYQSSRFNGKKIIFQEIILYSCTWTHGGRMCVCAYILTLRSCLGADHLTLEGGGGGGWFWKKFPASACRKKKIACSTNVIKSLREKKGKKYPAHHIARKKNSSWPEITHPHPQELNGGPLTFYIKRTVANCKHARQQQRVYLTSGCKCVCFEVKKVFSFLQEWTAWF